MERIPVWTENRMVRFGSIDTSNSLTLNAVFNFFQEAAISHADNLGVGREALAKTNQAWILSRISVLADRRPLYGETVTVRTWPRGSEKLFILRDFDIRGADDIPVVRARSCWLIIDAEKRRPLRPQPLIAGLPLNEGMDALPCSSCPPERVNLTEKAERRALYTDLDYNGHVNNVSYIRWIEDVLDPGLPEKARRMRLDINYINEILPGEVTGILSTEIEGTAGESYFGAFEGRKNQNQAAFRAELRLWF